MICEYCDRRKATQSAALVLARVEYNIQVCGSCARMIAHEHERAHEVRAFMQECEDHRAQLQAVWEGGRA